MYPEMVGKIEWKISNTGNGFYFICDKNDVCWNLGTGKNIKEVIIGNIFENADLLERIK